MLYWKFSDYRTFYLNEYWIFVPTAMLVNYFVIRNIASRKKQIEELIKLREALERYRNQEKLRRIVYLASGLSALSYISICRGGIDCRNYIDVEYIDCEIEEGLGYVDNERLRKIVFNLYKHKSKGKLIYITATALCHIANQYGQKFLAVPFAVNDFGFTNLYQTLRKAVVTLLLGGVPPLFVVGNVPALICAFLLATLGLKLAFINPEKILISPVSGMSSVKNLKPRIPGRGDVVSVNYRNKIVMANSKKEKPECWLPDQTLFNSACNIKSTEIPDAINVASHDLNYDEVVNMKDVTGLDRVDFSDVLDLGQAESSISKPRGKIVNFLKKFGDPETVSESETWETTTPLKKRYLRSRTRN